MVDKTALLVLDVAMPGSQKDQLAPPPFFSTCYLTEQAPRMSAVPHAVALCGA